MGRERAAVGARFGRECKWMVRESSCQCPLREEMRLDGKRERLSVPIAGGNEGGW